MPSTYYINSNNPTPATNYTSWATAANWTSTVARMCSAGNVVYYSHDHLETITTTAAAAWSWGWLGTSTSSVRVMSSVSSSGEPPTIQQFGASISTTAANNMVVVSTNAWVYFYGMAYQCGTASTAADLTLNTGNAQVVYERCRFKLGAQNTGSDFNVVQGLGGETILKHCSTLVTHADTAFQIILNAGTIRIIGGQTLSTTPNPLFESTLGGKIYVDGFDCSSLDSAFNFINTTGRITEVHVRNTRVPNSWTGNLNATAVISNGSVYELMNSDSADTNYRLAMRQPYGSCYHETTIVKTNGATDGVTPISWLVSTNAKAQWSHQFVESPEIVRWNTTVGSPITCTIDFLVGVTTMTNNQVWMEAQYLGLSGRPLGFFSNNTTTWGAPSSYQSISAADWTSTGITDPVRQKLSVTITPEEAGFIHAKVMNATSSTPIYVDPVIQLS